MLKYRKTVYGLSLAISFVLFFYYLLRNYDINYYDESGYIIFSKQISEMGLFNINESLRTYLLPLLISLVRIFTGVEIQYAKIIISILQYVLYIYTISLIGRYLFLYTQNTLIYYSIIVFGFLNPYLIQSTTLLLTDLLASCLITIAIFTTIFNSFDKDRYYYIVLFCSFSAVMVRPSSLILVPCIFALLILRKIMLKELSYTKGIIAGLISCVVFIPQLYNNVHNFSHWTILIHNNLYEFQSRLAATYLKYGTVVIPGEAPQLIFQTPFTFDAGTNIYDLIFNNTPAFLLTYFTHIFGVFDWGYIDTYIKDFYPVSRIVGSVFLYIFWITSVYGAVYFIRKGDLARRDRFILSSIMIPFVLYVLFIGTTVVESRFGYPLFFLLLPFFGYGVHSLYTAVKEKMSSTIWIIIRICLVYVLVIVLMFTLSFWLDSTTDRIYWFNY